MQWFSLQLAPFFVEIRKVYLFLLLASAIGYVLGQLGKSNLDEKLISRVVVGAWLVSLPVQYVVVKGIGSGETFGAIQTDDLGGIFLTVLLSAIGIIASFPVGIIFALGRQSDLPVIRFLCTLFIEVVRGVPLITLLFMGIYILPFVVEGADEVDRVILLGIVLMLFSSAYLAEVIRGGLQIIPTGQYEAAKAVGLNGFLTTTLIILPQALRAVIPAIMGQFVSLLKDTSLVAFVGLFEITGAMRKVLSDTQTGYTLFQREGYLYVGIVYFILCYILAEVSRRLEETGSGAIRRDTI